MSRSIHVTVNDFSIFMININLAASFTSLSD